MTGLYLNQRSRIQRLTLLERVFQVFVVLILFSCCSTTGSPESSSPDSERTLDSASSLLLEQSGFFNAASGETSENGHTNNWAVLVCTSRFWFNYRHVANTLSMYRTVKRLGIPDSNIILMLSDDVACNPRNKHAATVYNNNDLKLDLYGSNVEVDYRGYEVTVESFIRVLTGRHDEHVPRSKRLLTDETSNILIFMTGHGGDDFLKFQDSEEIGAQDIADAIAQMFEKKRYHELFFLIDTCQASTMYSKISSPNVLAAASSLKGESSYSHHASYELGVAVIDRFTYYNLEVLEHVDTDSKSSLQDLFNTYDPVQMHSTPGIRTDLFPRSMNSTLVTDFFGGVAHAELTLSSYSLSDRPIVSQTPKRVQVLHSQTSPPVSKKKSIKWSPNNKVLTFEFGLGITVSLVGLVFIVLYETPLNQKYH